MFYTYERDITDFILLCSTRMNDTNVCDAIRVGDEVTFEVTLEDTHCVDQRDFVLKIGPSGLDETLTVNVHVMCDCECQTEVGAAQTFVSKAF